MLQGGLLLVLVDRDPAGALEDGLLEGRGARLATICGDLVKYGSSSCGLSHDSYIVWVSPKEMYVLLHPFESQSLIKQPCICCSVFLEGLTTQPAECA